MSPMHQGYVQKRYSRAFKLQVVSDIESGRLSIEQARKRYAIGGGSTIQKWLKKFGKNHLLGKVVTIHTPDDLDHIKQLRQDKQQLESALAQAHLKIMALESQLEQALDTGHDGQSATQKKCATQASSP